MIRRLRPLLFALLAAWVAIPAAAHETTRSYLTISRDDGALSAALRVAFRDIEVAVWMDEDLDGAITWGEARRRLDAVDAYVRAGLSMRAGGACRLERASAGASNDAGVAYLDLGYAVRCPDPAATLTVASSLFLDIDADHRMFLRAETPGAAQAAVLGGGAQEARLGVGEGGPLAAFLAYLRSGVEHLLGGPDHLVFLLTLMLPAACLPGDPRRAALGVLTAATGFTLAHAVSLSAATTQLLRPPDGLIPALVAASIVITAVDNVKPFLPRPRAAVAAFFGLIHGFGFASALGALGGSRAEFAVALAGFNIGVEAGQIAVVLVVMPALYMLRGGRALLWTGSAGAFAIGLWWLASPFLPAA